MCQCKRRTRCLHHDCTMQFISGVFICRWTCSVVMEMAHDQSLKLLIRSRLHTETVKIGHAHNWKVSARLRLSKEPLKLCVYRSRCSPSPDFLNSTFCCWLCFHSYECFHFKLSVSTVSLIVSLTAAGVSGCYWWTLCSWNIDNPPPRSGGNQTSSIAERTLFQIYEIWTRLKFTNKVSLIIFTGKRQI